MFYRIHYLLVAHNKQQTCSRYGTKINSNLLPDSNWRWDVCSSQIGFTSGYWCLVRLQACLRDVSTRVPSSGSKSLVISHARRFAPSRKVLFLISFTFFTVLRKRQNLNVGKTFSNSLSHKFQQYNIFFKILRFQNWNGGLRHWTSTISTYLM